GRTRAVGVRGPPRQDHVRDGRRDRGRSATRDAAGRGQAVDQDQLRDAVCAGESIMKAGEARELSVDELRLREKDLDDQLFRLRIQKSMGQLEAPAKVRGVRRDLARIKTILREKTVGAKVASKHRSPARWSATRWTRRSSSPSSGKCVTRSTARRSARRPSS